MVKSTGILVAALVVSLGANAWLLVGSGSAGGGDTAVGVDDEQGADTTPAARPKACAKKLKACEAAAKLRPLLIGSGRPYAGSGTRTGDTEAEAEKAEFLCSIAREQAEDRWREKELEIVLGLRQALADEATQERDVKAAVEKFGDKIGLSDAQRVDFERRYRTIRKDRMEKVRSAMEGDPPDFKEVIAQTRALFDAEDDLASELGGEQAGRVLHDAERKDRSALLSVAATLAGVPWEEALR